LAKLTSPRDQESAHYRPLLKRGGSVIFLSASSVRKAKTIRFSRMALYASTLTVIMLLLVSDAYAQLNTPQVLLYTIEPPRRAPEYFMNPATLDVGPDGTLYVLDNDNHRIQYFDKNGNYKGSIGSLGRPDGHFLSLDDLSVGSDGSVYVADHFTFGEGWPVQRLQHFGRDGQFLGRVRFPVRPAAVGSDEIYSFDYDRGRILKYSIDGSLINAWGKYGKGDGEFGLGHHIDIDIDKDGMVFVADSGNHRIQYFTANGTYIGKWGQSGSTKGKFSGEMAITIATDDTVYILDVQDDPMIISRIQKFSRVGDFIDIIDQTSGIVDLIVDIVSSPNGRIYALAAATGEIRQYESNGIVSRRIGSLSINTQPLENVRSVTETSNGDVVVNNGIHAIFLNSYGAIRNTIDLSKSIDDYDEYTRFPGRVVTAPAGTLYTIVTKRKFVSGRESTLDTDVIGIEGDSGKVTSRWRFESIRELGLNQERSIPSLVLGPDRYLYITSIYQNQVQKYTLSGKLEKQWAISEITTTGLDSEAEIDANENGDIYVLQYWWSENESKAPPPPTIRKFNSSGTLISDWAFDEEIVRRQGKESKNHYAMSVGSDNRIYIGARHKFSNGELQVYKDTGDLIGRVGNHGYGPYEHIRADFLKFYPVAIEALHDGRVVVADVLPGNDQVQLRVFGYIHNQSWKANYYKNRDFSEWPSQTAMLDREELVIDFGELSPANGIPSDDFAARISKTIRVSHGVYRFRVQSNGGVRVWIGNNLLLDRWNDNRVDEESTITLFSDEYLVDVEYTDRGGNASLGIRWSQARALPFVALPLVVSRN